MIAAFCARRPFDRRSRVRAPSLAAALSPLLAQAFACASLPESTSMPTFLDLGVPEALCSVLAATGKAEPFAIQRDTLPDSLAGRDVLGRGRTGSGKTIAFALPLVARLSGAFAARRTRGLVLAPTRELATQIAETIKPLADAAGLTVTTIFGGVSQKPQEQALRSGVDIVVACPGRLEDLMKQKVADLSA